MEPRYYNLLPATKKELLVPHGKSFGNFCGWQVNSLFLDDLFCVIRCTHFTELSPQYPD